MIAPVAGGAAHPSVRRRAQQQRLAVAGSVRDGTRPDGDAGDVGEGLVHETAAPFHAGDHQKLPAEGRYCAAQSTDSVTSSE